MVIKVLHLFSSDERFRKFENILYGKTGTIVRIWVSAICSPVKKNAKNENSFFSKFEFLENDFFF